MTRDIYARDMQGVIDLYGGGWRVIGSKGVYLVTWTAVGGFEARDAGTSVSESIVACIRQIEDKFGVGSP